jgi:hypothetical protein
MVLGPTTELIFQISIVSFSSVMMTTLHSMAIWVAAMSAITLEMRERCAWFVMIRAVRTPFSRSVLVPVVGTVDPLALIVLTVRIQSRHTRLLLLLCQRKRTFLLISRKESPRVLLPPPVVPVAPIFVYTDDDKEQLDAVFGPHDSADNEDSDGAASFCSARSHVSVIPDMPVCIPSFWTDNVSPPANVGAVPSPEEDLSPPSSEDVPSSPRPEAVDTGIIGDASKSGFHLNYSARQDS